MVDSISQSGGMPGIKRTTADAASKVSGGVKAAATGAATSTPASGDTMEISATSTALPQALQSGPPIEMELVTKLQERIAAGDYPIDLDAITESLFQSYLELND